MSEELVISKDTDKKGKYEVLIPQIKALISSEENLIANLANITAALFQTFQHLWTGFYIVEENELVLGPFQGPIACTRIGYGKGVCGMAWKENKTLLVGDVDKFPGHIACSSLSKSEIVVPVTNNKVVKLILDIDSVYYNGFNEIDQKYLGHIAELISQKHFT